MKLSKRTIEILKSFSRIQSSLLVKEGNFLTTASNDKSVMAFTNVEEELPEFCIFNLGEFLNFISMFKEDEVDLVFKNKYIEINSNGSKIKYYLANDAISEELGKIIPNREPNIGEPTLSFDLSRDEYKLVTKSASLLSADSLQIKNDEIRVYRESLENSAGNDFTHTITSENNGEDNHSIIKISNLPTLDGNYKVNVFHHKKCVVFHNTDIDVKFLTMYVRGDI